MFKLKLVRRTGLYQIHSERHKNAYEGTPATLFKMAMHMGLPEMELASAVNRFNRFDHDYATFDSTGKLIETGSSGGDDGPHGFGWH